MYTDDDVDCAVNHSVWFTENGGTFVIDRVLTSEEDFCLIELV
jgi:hypothetical protein